MRLSCKSILVILMVLGLSACVNSSLSFAGLNYTVQQPQQVGRMVLIVSKADAKQQITLPGDSVGSTNDQTVNVGKMLLQVAAYEYPKIFSTYQQVDSMKAIPVGFYLSIMSLGVDNLAVLDHKMVLTINANYYSYQGKLLLQKEFSVRVPLQVSLQKTLLEAYRQVFAKINNRLTQILAWEQRQSIPAPLPQAALK